VNGEAFYTKGLRSGQGWSKSASGKEELNIKMVRPRSGRNEAARMSLIANEDLRFGSSPLLLPILSLYSATQRPHALLSSRGS